MFSFEGKEELIIFTVMITLKITAYMKQYRNNIDTLAKYLIHELNSEIFDRLFGYLI